jgi:hypothetical protein
MASLRDTDRDMVPLFEKLPEEPHMGPEYGKHGGRLCEESVPP